MDKNLKKLFFNTYKFSNLDNNNTVVKGGYTYEYVHDWEKFNGTSLPAKEDFYSRLNMEHVNDVDYVHAKKVCKDFEI